MLLLRKWTAHSPFFSKVISNSFLSYLYCPSKYLYTYFDCPVTTNFVSNVARESKRVAYPCPSVLFKD